MRARVHLAFLVTAALIVAAATIGAVFAAAAEESIQRDVLGSAPAGRAAVHLTAQISPDDATFRPELFTDALARTPRAGALPSFPERVPAMALTTAVQASEVGGRQPTRLLWRDGACRHVRTVAGRCPTRVGEAMVSRDTLGGDRAWRIGSTVRSTAAGELRIVGVYLPRDVDGAYWSGRTYFDGGRTTIDEQGNPVATVDSLLVALPELVDRADSLPVEATVDYPLVLDGSPVGDGTALRGELRTLSVRLRGTDFVSQSDIPGLLGSAAAQRHYVAESAGLVAVQMVLLGSVVLFFVTVDLTEGRRREIALAKLRGQSSAAVARFALAEPLLVLAASLPLGLVAGFLAAVLLGLLVLRPGTPVVLPTSTAAAAGLALLGAVLAAAVSTRRVLRRPILEQWADARPRRDPRTTRIAWAAAALVLLAGAVVLPAVTTAGTPTVVLEPAALLALTALVGVPLVALLALGAAPRSRATHRIGRFLAVRRLGRSDAARRAAVLLVITLGLATFAVSGQSVLTGNRAARAQAELGASRVLAVQYRGVDPVRAVARADAGGTWAMAAAEWLPDGGESVAGEVLALDPSRLAAVALPVRSAPPETTLARLIDARNVPDIGVTADRLTVRIAAEDLKGDAPADVVLKLSTTAGLAVRADAGGLRTGEHDYSARIDCTRGCVLTGIAWVHPAETAQAVSGSVTIRTLTATRSGTTTSLQARLGDARAWRAAVPVSESTDRVRVTADGVSDRFRTASGESGVDVAAWDATLPTVTTPGGLVRHEPDAGWSVTTEQGGSAGLRPVSTVPLLPRALDLGAAMDVRALDADLPGFAEGALWQVWLDADAPSDAVQRLQRAGLTFGSSTTVAEREQALSREGPALAFSLLLALAVAAAALAVLATAVSTGAAVRSRATETAALRLIGVPARTVTRAAVLEQASLLLVAAVLGIPAGVLAVAVVLPQLRQSASASPVPLSVLPSPLPILFVAGAYAVVVGFMGLVAARGVVRAAGPARLREVDG